MIKVSDDEVEYWLEEGHLMTLHIDDGDIDNAVQIDAKDFSSFEHDVWCFLMSMEQQEYQNDIV